MKNKNIISALTLTLISPLALQAQSKPNIILFLVDDMGWQDTSVPFDKVRTTWNNTYHTPNMEKLALKGVKFTQAYASAISSPTRVSLMTGMNPTAHRVTNWTLNRDKSQDQADKTLDFPSWNMNGLQPVGQGISNTIEATTLPQILQQNGYYTIHCGKAHFGATQTPGANPKNIGFDVNIAGHAAGGTASYLGKKNFGNVAGAATQTRFAVPGLEKYWGQDIFLSQALTIEALAALDTLRAKTPDKPFFLYMSHYAIHVPLDVDNRYYQKYRDAGLDHSQAAYASLIEGMDQSLGELSDYIEKNNLAQNTIIIFMSDNGGLSACGRSGPANRHNWPLRSGKGSSYEGGTRVPMIVYDPMIKRRQEIETTPVDITDFMPTILDMAGVHKYKTVQKLDGKNIMPLIKGKKLKNAESRLFVWHFPNRWDCSGEGIGTYSAIRQGDYKFIYFYDTQKSELYNLANDLSESRNLAGKAEFEPIRVKLAAELTNYIKQHNGQLPSSKANGQLCAYPH
ncbi:MAG: sulfatase [Mucinivorans sp.]